MTNRRYHLPIMATVIGLVVAGCGGGGDDDTISVTVIGPAISASERVLGIAAAIAPLLPGAVAPALRQITPAVERTAVGGVRVTVTAAPVGPDFEFLDSTPLDDVWSRAGLRGSETGSREHITVYTNIENPRRPFGSVYTLDEDNALTVDFATHSMRVRSSEFPLPNFDREYVNAEDLSFLGTFHGVAGTYECTTPPCTVSTANDGMISSAGDTWTFTPDSDLAGEVMIDLPDADHLYFGWWLKEPTDAEDAYAFRTFSGGTVPFAVGDKFTSGHTDGLLGTASYQGRAAGQYVTKDFTGGVLSGGTAGVFTATASLTANFGGDDIAVNDQFNIRGSVTEFRDVERDRSLEGWSVTLNKVDLAPGSASFGGTAGDTTTATLGVVTGTGTWEGAFFGNARADGKPGAVAGVFDANLPAAHIAGGFGAINTAADE